MDECMNVGMDKLTDGKNDGSMPDGWINGSMDGGWTDRGMVGWNHAWMD